jgi:hypothetical protein
MAAAEPDKRMLMPGVSVHDLMASYAGGQVGDYWITMADDATTAANADADANPNPNLNPNLNTTNATATTIAYTTSITSITSNTIAGAG